MYKNYIIYQPCSVVTNTNQHITRLHRKLTAALLTVFLLSGFVNKLSAQQFNNWYFPQFAGITFNTNPPSALTDGLITFTNGYSCASISNNLGQLLFYSDGVKVWNKNHQVMPNGTGLYGGGSQINSILIVPFPADEKKFYLFTAQGWYGSNIGAPLGCRYSVVDISLDSGRGDITQKNIPLLNTSFEKMTAVSDADGSSVWIIFKGAAKLYYSFKVTCTGIVLSPITSNVGLDLSLSPYFAPGDIKSSLDGNYTISNFIGNPSYFDILKFNKNTGAYTQGLTLRIPNFQPSGIEFSPDSKLAYLSGTNTNSNSTVNLYQIKVDIYDSATIINSAQLIYSSQLRSSGALQLGPDGKIYHGTCGNYGYLDQINFPNVAGTGCGFQPNSIYLNGPLTACRLPYSFVNLITNQNVQIPTYTIAADCRTVTLTGKTYIKGNNLTFKWRFGDGDSTIQVVPSGGDTTYTTVTHTFPLAADTFNVQLFVTSDTVCGQGSAGKRVTFGLVNRPTARFGYTATCGSLSVPFSDSSLANGIAALSYSWRFLDKNNVLLGTSALQNPTFTFPGYDTVKAMLIVSGNNACTRPDTLVKTIILKAKPIASFTYTNTCGSLSATFTNASTITTGSVQSSTWLLGDGTTSTLQNPAHAYSSFGTYTAKLVVTSTSGCTSDTAVQTIAIKAKPIARIAYDTNACAASPVLLRDSSTVAASTVQSFYWQAQGQSFSQANIQPVFAIGGSYATLHAVTSAQGCASDTISQNIFIESVPVAAITAPATGCTGDAVTFTSNSTIASGSIKSLRWQVGSNPLIIQTTPAPFTYTFAAAGSYTMSLQAVSSHGCLSNTATANIATESKPVADFTNSLLCPGKTVQFTNSSTAAGTISSSQWSINNAAPTIVIGAGNYSYTFSRGGTYTVQLTVTTAGGCSSTITKTILVEPAIASAGNDTIVREGQPFVLQGSGGTSYLWQPPAGLSDATTDKPVGVLNNTQRYSVQITTAQGCIGFDTVLITVLRNLKIANAFSPNGDGINDEWRIDQLKDYPNAQLQLFDRYGQIVYTAKGNGIIGWKGTAGGSNKPAPVGTYYYVITLNNELNKKPYTGWVMVVR